MTNVSDAVKRKRENERLRCVAVKRKAVEYMGNKCCDCGASFPPAVYDFHHLNPKEKEHGLSRLLRKGWEATRAELEKCVMLCANCHRIRHFEGDP